MTEKFKYKEDQSQWIRDNRDNDLIPHNHASSITITLAKLIF